MVTFCIMCRELIREDRQRRGAVTCCPDHAKEYRRQRRAERAKKSCRLCGRSAKRSKAVEPVPHEHTPLATSKAVELTHDFIRNRFERVS